MNTLALLLTVAALPLGTCLRLSERAGNAHANETDIEPPDETGLVPADELEDEGFASKVPPIDTYRRVWARRYSLERHLQDPLPSSIKMILGVFTVAPDHEYREVVRRTWQQQAGVCYWTHGPMDNCSVYTAFVIGKYGQGSEIVNVSTEEVDAAYKEEGMLVLDIPENMNRGKSLTWFRTALQMFPWATHIAKMDMDTYPFVHKLVHRMETNRTCMNSTDSTGGGPYEFIGRPHDSFGAIFTKACPYEPCQGHFLSRADVHRPVAGLYGQWRFLSGEFYIMSLPLVQKLRWSKQKGGTEDSFVSDHVQSAAREGQFCVTLRRLDAWFHRNSWVDAAYSNIF